MLQKNSENKPSEGSNNIEEIFSRIGDVAGLVFGSLGRTIERSVTSLFGSSNARFMKKLQPTVEAINALEPKFQEMTDEELREMTVKFRKRLAAGETLDDLLIEAFAVCREAGRRVLGMRHYDVQLMGGMVLHRGNIAEMVTGEGKTLVATLPAYLNALEGRGVHVVTVNDYLARRDMEWMGPLYMSLGISVGAIQSNMETLDRQKAYDCDITYGTNNEFGFDYLRDNMRPAAKGDDRYDKWYQQSQGKLHYAIIDEVDNILIDEARTPLIISGPAHDDVTRYQKADRIARQLTKAKDFEVNEKEHSAHLTDEGIRAAEHLAGVESFYTAGHMEWPHLIDNSLKAHHLYKRDVNYVVQGDEVIIVDEFTGRLMPGRNWSDGLHQAVEAKEGVKIKEENQTLATITLQNFFKLYDKLCGMTGTAMTEAAEFWKIYHLDVISIPTNRELQRDQQSRRDLPHGAGEVQRHRRGDRADQQVGFALFAQRRGVRGPDRGRGRRQHRIPAQGLQGIGVHPQGENQGNRAPRPADFGGHRLDRKERTAFEHDRKAGHSASSLERQASSAGGGNRRPSGAEKRRDDRHEHGRPRNGHHFGRESRGDGLGDLAGKISHPARSAAGRMGQTRAGNRTARADEARRARGGGDGRAAHHRQRTPRSAPHRLAASRALRPARRSRFEPLLPVVGRRFNADFRRRLGEEHPHPAGNAGRRGDRQPHGFPADRRAQKKVEERNFETRKNLLEYDEVMDEQRKRVYRYRQNILDGIDCKQLIMEMIQQQVDKHLDEFLAKDYGQETFAEWAGKILTIEFDAKDFRGLDFDQASHFALEEADRKVEGQVLDLIEENLPSEEDVSEWNWEALAKTANSRWKLSLRDRDLRQLGRDQVGEFLIEKAREMVTKIDLGDGEVFLLPDFGVRSAFAWVKMKFGFDLDIEAVRKLEPEAFKSMVRDRAGTIYNEREIEYPVMAGLYHFTTRDAGGHKRYDREKLAEWARPLRGGIGPRRFEEQAAR